MNRLGVKNKMKLSQSYFYTLRENAKDEDSKSGNLLVRAGYIKKASSGIYMMMPLGYKVLKNIETVIREEMEAIHTQEMSMPVLIAEDVYIASGRRDIIGSSMFKLKDRYQKAFVLGPTHEELFAQAAQMMIHSYKDMPVRLYQFQTKFRDEARPRFGLIRVREFVMKDAYSFDADPENLDIAYEAMRQAYINIFDRLGLDYRIVTADTGIMGGLLSEEFQALTDIGEDILVLSDGYASNLEIAEHVGRLKSNEQEEKPLEKVYTPNAKTINEISDYLNLPAESFVKTLIYKVDDKIVAVCVSGSRDVNEVKLRKLYEAKQVELADFDTVMAVSHASVGFSGPIGLDIDIVVDQHIQDLKNFVIGANEDNYHYINANFSQIKITHIADVSNVQEGDPNPNGTGVLHFSRGIEIGNIFKLGTKYSKAMNLQYADQNNSLQDVHMGSYGIGLGRIMAALTEQRASAANLDWPMSVAPYKLAIVVVNSQDETQLDYANKLYDKFVKLGVTTLLDDRHERPGVKFKDMELIGIPLRITVGRDLAQRSLEFKVRHNENIKVPLEEIEKTVLEMIASE